jgi:hypothetical protein
VVAGDLEYGTARAAADVEKTVRGVRGQPLGDEPGQPLGRLGDRGAVVLVLPVAEMDAAPRACASMAVDRSYMSPTSSGVGRDRVMTYLPCL